MDICWARAPIINNVPQSLADPEGKLSPLDVALKKAQEGHVAQQVEKELLLERAHTIPQREIDALTEEKLPIDQDDQQILYNWAKDLKKERLQDEILKERDKKFLEIAQNGPEKLAELHNQTQTVLKYLDKKEKVRTRAFGRVRWNQCMSFLNKTMPKDEFKAYCDHVNEVRGVKDDSAHKDYVTPESFDLAPKKKIKINAPAKGIEGPTVGTQLGK